MMSGRMWVEMQVFKKIFNAFKNVFLDVAMSGWGECMVNRRG